jgi:PKD repeat protein
MKKRLQVGLVLIVALLFFSVQSWSQAVFEIKSPSKANGFYNFGIGDSTTSSWGNGVLAKKAVSGNLAIASGVDSLAGNTLTGNYQGKILLVHRGGGFDFAIKTLNAQNAGAIAVIIVNHGIQTNGSVDSLDYFNPSGIRANETASNATGLQIHIPIILIGLKDGIKLKNAIRSEGNVSAYLGGKQTYNSEKDLLSFGFITPDSSKIKFYDNTYYVRIPKGTDPTKMVAKFTNSDFSKVLVNGKEQISGSTINNFTKKVEYVVVAQDGSKKSYFVEVDFCTYDSYCIIDASSEEVCPNTKVNLRFSYVKDFTNPKWDFGNGKSITTSSINNSVEATYSDTGSYLVALSFNNKACFNAPDTMYKLIKVSKNIQPTVDFNLSKTVLCPNESFSLYSSSYNEKSYAWNMGDGVTYSKYNINHSFKDEGEYLVKLTLTNTCGNSATISKVIKVSKKASTYFKDNAYIYSYSKEACVGQPISFNTSSNQGVIWDFKDNTPTTSEKQPIHSFKYTGDYLVQAKLTNYCGIDTIVSTLVKIKNAVPFRNVQALSDETICPGQITRLYYSGNSSDFKSVSWILPGNVSVNNDVYKSFSNGDNVVQLKLTNYCGNDTLLTKTINVKNNLFVSSNIRFNNYTSDEYCPGEEASQSVYVDSYNSYKSIVWTGEGLTNSDKGYAYFKINTPGVYTINAKLTNYCGKDTTISKTIKIVNSKKVESSFDQYYLDKIYCPGQEVYLYYNNSGSFKTSVFDYGDNTIGTLSNHTYKQIGDYTVKLKLTNYCNADTTIQGIVKINQVPLNKNAVISFYSNNYNSDNIDFCKGDEIELSIYDNSSNTYKSISWNFGDGTSEVTDSRYTSHIFQKSGLLNIKATLMNFCGDTITVSKQINIRTDVAFKGRFDLNYIDKVCPNEIVNFSSNKNFKLISWDFGDNKQAQGNNVSHAYSNLGEYQLKVTFKNNCNLDTILTRVIAVSKDVVPDFYFSELINGMICPGEKATFYKSAESNDYQYTYDFGDKSTTYDESVLGNRRSLISHKYKAVGDYKIVVTAKNKCGLTAKDSAQVKVVDGLKIESFNEQIEDDEITIDTSFFIVNSNGLQFVWNFGGNNIVKTDVPFIKHYFKPNSTDKITVFVTTACGDTATFVKYYNKVENPGSSTNGVEENKRTVLNIYPNPSTGTFTISGAPIGQYAIVNELGALVHQFEVKTSLDQTIQMDGFATGIYFLRSLNVNFVQEKIVVMD